MNLIRKQQVSGQALIESIAIMSLIALTLLLTFYFSRLLDFQRSMLLASRYAIWTGNDNATGELDRRFLNDKREVIETANENNTARAIPGPQFTNINGDVEIVKSDDEAGYLAVTQMNSRPPVTNIGMDQLAGSTKFGVGVLQADVGLDLPHRSYLRTQIAGQYKLSHWLANKEVLLKFSESGAILNDAWMPANEQEFTNRVNGLVADQSLLSLLELALYVVDIGKRGLFVWKEASYAVDAEFQVTPNNQSLIIPRYENVSRASNKEACRYGCY